MSSSSGIPPLPPPSAAEAPKKKRRTLKDAETELEESRNALQDARKKLIMTARENAKMKVLLMKYIDKDDSLMSTSQLESSQLTMSQQEAEPTQSTVEGESQSLSPRGTVTTFDEGESSEQSLWSSDFAQDEDAMADGFLEPVSQLSQMSQMSHWSELSSTSNLDDIISFLEKQDTSENDRMAALKAEYKELKEAQTVVRVGVGVLIVSKDHPECVLVGRRKGSHGAGKMALPGGHLEMYESWAECASRELKEETDLDVAKDKIRFAYVTNDPMEDEGKHYITLFTQASVTNDHVVRNMEPHKCVGWEWIRWGDLCARDDMFLPLFHITRSGFVPKWEL